MSSEKKFINPIEFFDVFEQFTKALADTLEEYQEKEIQKEDTPKVEKEECKCNKDNCCCECDTDCICNSECSEKDEQLEQTGHTDTFSYKNTITDYTVKDYAEALTIMKPVLDALVFDMRTFKYTDATLTFEFCDCTYKFYWDKKLDRFAGIEYLDETTCAVYWDEISGQIKDFDEETLKKQSEVNDDLTAVENPIVKQETSENKKPITGRTIFDKVNNICKCKDNILGEALERVEFILQNDLYECGEKDVFGNIYSIRFPLLQVFGSTLELENFKKCIDTNDFANTIRKKFEFQEVFIDTDKNAVICYLV